MSVRRTRHPFATLVIWAVCLTPFVLFCVFPLGLLAARALQGATTSAPLITPRSAALLGRSLALSLLVAAVATGLGTLLGLRLGATNWPGKRIAHVASILPLLVPPYLHAIGWTTLLRSDGRLSTLLTNWFGVATDTTANVVYSFGGAVAVLSLAYFPVAALFTAKSLEWSSPALVEAARAFGAGPWRTFLVARWPFLRPAVLSSAMIVFLLAASDLGVPTILKVDVFNFEVFTQLSAFNDTRTATLLCLPLAAVGVLALGLERRVTGSFVQADVNIEPPRRASHGATAINAGLFTIALSVGVLLPLGAIVAAAFRGKALTKMAQLAVEPAWNTIRYASFAAAALLGAALALTAVLRRMPSWARRSTDRLLTLGFAVPSPILALGLLALYDRPGVSIWITPTVLVVAAIVARYAIVALRIIQQSVHQIPEELFEAAANAGAGPAMVLWRIALPLIRTPLLAVAALGFLFAAGEVGSTILLHPPGGETLPIALYAIEANAPRAYVAALALIQLMVLGTVLVLFAISWRIGRADRIQRGIPKGREVIHG